MPRRRRQRSSWGSNEPAGPGRRRIRFWADMGDGTGYRRHSMTIEGSRRDADDKIAELRTVYGSRRSGPARPAQMTVGEAYERWYLPDMQARLDSYLRDPRPGRRGELLKPSTFDQYVSAWRAHVQPEWGDTFVGDVSYDGLQTWISGKTNQQAQRCLSMMRAILNFCLRAQLVDVNVALYDYRLPARGASRGDGIWTLDELVNRIWPAVYGRACEPAFILSAFDSCRTGECLAPRLDEIREVERDGMVLASIPIMRQVGNEGEVSADGDLKNRWSPRPTVLPEPWSERILELRDKGLRNGEIWLSDNGLGEPIGQRTVRRDFKSALAAAGIEAQQFRALRRSWRSWIAGMGIPTEILEKMMGHIGEGTTGRHYLKLTEELITNEVARAFAERPVRIDWDR